MKLGKTLLLGSGVALVATGGAQAADLPTKKAAPAEYVRICAVHGPGFFYIPGSDTCIRISGRTRFEYVVSRAFDKSTDPSSFFAVGRIALDARTQTDWGLLRAYIRVDMSRRSGNNWFGSGSAARGGTAFGFGGGVGGVASGFPSFALTSPVEAKVGPSDFISLISQASGSSTRTATVVQFTGGAFSQVSSAPLP